MVCIDMRNNNLGKEGGEALLNALKEHPSITTFSTIPVQALKENSITELDLSKKRLGVGEAIILSYYVKNNGAMTSLNLASNNLKAEGAKHAAEAIKANVSNN